MRNTFIIIILYFSVSNAYAEKYEKPDDCKKEDIRPRCMFSLDEDGKVHTDDGEAERTFSFPAIKTGFILDLKVPNLLPFISVELTGWGILDERFAFDIGGTAGRVFISLDYELVPIMKLGPSVWIGWHVPYKTWTFGLGFSIIKF